MADDPTKKGADAKRASTQDYEIDYLVRETGRRRDEVVRAIERHGPSREAVMRALGK
ncbi:MAG: DUF3606 domain-containing protein [Reyranellaceae bacterium]